MPKGQPARRRKRIGEPEGLFQNRPGVAESVWTLSQVLQERQPDASDLFGELRMSTQVLAKETESIVLIRPKPFA